ncbi:hypothetical protein HNQ59_004021 [Chitinivorax tropicus]|uniref:Uncharacterized protein n=1 Tax=Chitinivorax tropicus TaxID=714531 RepID=A0A840MWK6_9PROT|nr:hypothetical protein [Chitinivorax tropicus]MBB5020696.1 hypothetical protein [Chitinivorax tropicus]
MHIYDYYGIRENDTTVAVRQLALALGIEFSLHESSFWGEYFRADIGGGGCIRIISNFYDGDWHKEEYRQYPLLLEINEIADPDTVMQLILRIEGIDFLYRSEVEEKRWIRRYKYEGEKFLLIDEKIL